MKVFLFLLGFFLTNQFSLAADGPQNSGLLTLELGETNLEGHLQIDRNVITSLFGGETIITPQLINQLFKVASGNVACAAGEPTPLISDAVVTAIFSFDCNGRRPWEVEVTLLNTDRLPEGFSLGIRGASGHFSLDRTMTTTSLLTNRAFLYFQVGLGFFGGNNAVEAADIGRQAALWFGGFHRLPPGIGLLLLLLAIALMPFKLLTKIAITILTLAVAAGTSFTILANKQTQTIYAFLYYSHVYFALLVALLALVFVRPEPLRRAASLGILMITALCYGFELAIVLQNIERLSTGELARVAGSFYLGVLATLSLIFVCLFALGKILEKLAAKRQGSSLLWPAIVSGLGISCCIYLLVNLFLRLRI